MRQWSLNITNQCTLLRSQQQTWSSNTMEVSLSVLREVEVDDDVDSLDVNTSGEEIYWKRIVNLIIISDNLCAFLDNMMAGFEMCRYTTETHQCRPGFCTVHFWSRGTHGFYIPENKQDIKYYKRGFWICTKTIKNIFSHLRHFWPFCLQHTGNRVRVDKTRLSPSSPGHPSASIIHKKKFYDPKQSKLMLYAIVICSLYVCQMF